jgi:hypothetical protein
MIPEFLFLGLPLLLLLLLLSASSSSSLSCFIFGFSPFRYAVFLKLFYFFFLDQVITKESLLSAQVRFCLSTPELDCIE